MPTPAAAPVLSPTPGAFDGSQSVTITCASVGATIYYTLDGTTPTNQSLVYAQPVPVNQSTVVKTFATGGGFSGSPVVTGTYTITTLLDMLVQLQSILAAIQSETASIVAAANAAAAQAHADALAAIAATNAAAAQAHTDATAAATALVVATQNAVTQLALVAAALSTQNGYINKFMQDARFKYLPR